MEKGVFKFKKFKCRHSDSSMKIGVDAVLLGAWAGNGTESEILDVGTGCGVISLMLAQRNEKARILAIDIDKASVNEAEFNFFNSPWQNRMSVLCIDFSILCKGNQYKGRFDHIVSNPPYFNSGIFAPETRREIARHEGVLSPSVLVENSAQLLTPNGILSMIVPFSGAQKLIDLAKESGLALERLLFIKGNINSPVKRSLLEFRKSDLFNQVEQSELILEEAPGQPTIEHFNLCKDFYLKW